MKSNKKAGVTEKKNNNEKLLGGRWGCGIFGPQEEGGGGGEESVR